MARKKSYIEQSADEGLIDHSVVRGLEMGLSGRGGPGRGQGLKAADGATGLKRRNISIDDASADVLRQLGDGDLSLGVRRAAAKSCRGCMHEQEAIMWGYAHTYCDLRKKHGRRCERYDGEKGKE